jgi:hypothetical protein
MSRLAVSAAVKTSAELERSISIIDKGYARICRFATTKPLHLLHCGEFQVNLAYIKSWLEILLYWNVPRHAKRASLLHDILLLATRSSNRSPLRRRSIIAICAGIPCIRKLKAKILISEFRRIFAGTLRREV